MFRRPRKQLVPLADRGPLRVMFFVTSMPVGGAETLLVNLIRRLDREHFLPELCCLKDLGPLGEELANEIPVHSDFIGGKYDVAVLGRLTRMLAERRIDAAITVGAGDKMFWGRLAAWRARVPVVASALHSTGWPDGISRLNRLLTRITDAFIGVAVPHGKHLLEVERFPAEKVFVIPNGIDTDRFRPQTPDESLRAELGLAPTDRAVAIVAALRPEKNHAMLLEAIAQVRRKLPEAALLVVGEGPERSSIERRAKELGIADAVRMLGNRSDVPAVLATADVFALSSHMEANPVSILEALACEIPVVAPRVGSIPETVLENETGYLVDPGNAAMMAERIRSLLSDEPARERMGKSGRQLVANHWSLDKMVKGYEQLLASIYTSKCRPAANPTPPGSDHPLPNHFDAIA
jgi:glycosyltransferase involved in cell wall biosynthesis